MAARRAFPWPAAAPALLLLLLLLLLVPHSAALPSLKPGAPVLRENRVIFVKERLSAEVAQAELSRHHFAFVVGAHHR